ncbi:MAG TPA: SDR family NAD(P)-dependent oxidoreductase [Oligoflexus sp.]|nr:SDR family NAD(P)-dependent oxidoreductase [Oligoflexus sp.]
MNLKQRWVLITGASSGLGEAMARQLAAVDGAHLVLVARRRDRLEALAEELVQHGVKCHVLTADLSEAAAVEELFAALQRENIHVTAAILNAGTTHFGAHHELSWSSAQAMLATNLQSLVHLTSLISNDMRQRGEPGALMLISSLAGSAPVPYQSLYSGTKAFVTQFGQALGFELRPFGISLTVFAPGGIATEMTENSRLNRYFRSRAVLMPAEVCGREALRALRRRQSFAIPGFVNRVSMILSRLVGLRVSTCLVGRVYAKALKARSRPLLSGTSRRPTP